MSSSSSTSDITGLLIDWCEGDQDALEALAPIVEKELRRLAHHYLQQEHPGHTLQTTAVINEAYLRLINQNRVRWQNRAHFYGIAARIMRRILLNYARDQKRIKRGGGALQVSLSEVGIMTSEKSSELIALDEALERLAIIDERKARVVELRYFGGLSVEETAEVLNVSEATINREWKMARAMLAREIRHGV
ncbi:MAG: sigma-70 family RNA polymerase sigma factor [Pyrinomonadaceae bacterium]|nr:sigma-70 family RNA polymerase sigma factor [Pyrinomonadaceae bacterium]